jgi:putative transposase
MRLRRSTRLPGFAYHGCYRYFVTICTGHRSKTFTALELVDLVRSQLLRTAFEFEFTVIAYCFMPDHLHALVEGQTDAADFLRFMHAFKQRSAFAWTRTHGTTLWERGYFEHVLRNDESTVAVARYILGNPVRAGLVASPAEYPYSGSDTLQMGDLLESVMKM